MVLYDTKCIGISMIFLILDQIPVHREKDIEYITCVCVMFYKKNNLLQCWKMHFQGKQKILKKTKGEITSLWTKEWQNKQNNFSS